MDTTTSDETPSKLTGLQSQVEVLTDLYNQIQALHRLPTLLVQPPVDDGLGGSARHNLELELQRIKGLQAAVRSDRVQGALKCARDSLKADTSGLNANLRREMRKRRRPPTPESPRPFIAETKSRLLFPRIGNPKLHLGDNLLGFIQEFNGLHKSKLQIWEKHRGIERRQPMTLRLRIPDVLIAYIQLEYPDRVGVASVTTFGPREKKAPHAQSDYSVYQSLSQQLAKMLEQEPEVTLEGVMSLLGSYEGLFIERCRLCDRILSVEGHLPPVVREWAEDESESETGAGTHTMGSWTARHAGCR